MDTNRTMLITSLNSCSLTKGRDVYLVCLIEQTS